MHSKHNLIYQRVGGKDRDGRVMSKEHSVTDFHWPNLEQCEQQNNEVQLSIKHY